MIQIVGDFSDDERLYSEGKITLEEKQKRFETARYHSLRGDIMPFAVGGSDAPVIMGHSKWNTPLLLQKQKLNPGKYQEAASSKKQHMFEWGHLAEDAVAQMNITLLSEKLGLPVRWIPCTKQFRNTQYPHCVANIDCLVKIGKKTDADESNPHDWDLYLGEVKTTSWAGKNSDWDLYFSKNQIPPHYVDQVYFYLGILPFLKGAVMLAGCGFNTETDFAQIVVERNDKLSCDILQHCEEFVTKTSKGIAASNANVTNHAAISRSIPILYGKENSSKPQVELRWKDAAFKRLDFLEEKKKALEADIEPLTNAYEKSIAGKQKQLNAIDREEEAIYDTFKEDIENGTQGHFVSKNGQEYVVSLDRSRFGFDADVRAEFKKRYPKIYEEISLIKPKIKASYKKIVK